MPAGLAPEEVVRILAQAYRSASERIGGYPSRYGLQLEGHAHYEKMAEIGARMLADEIPPLSWVVFTCDVWTNMKRPPGGRAVPPALFCWSLKLYEEQQGWYADTQRLYDHHWMLDEHRALWDDWHAMWAALLQEAPTTYNDLLRILDRFFPGDQWERRVAQIHRKVAQAEREMTAQLDRGGWP